MKTYLLNIILLFSIYSSNAQAIPKVEKGSIVRIENFNSKYITARNIDIWLPNNYDANKKYAVLYGIKKVGWCRIPLLN